MAFSLEPWLSLFRGSVSSMDVALLRTHQRGYQCLSWRTLCQEISYFLQISSADEELPFCASLSPMGLSGNRVSGHSGRRAGSATPYAVPRPPDISISGVEGPARLA